MSSIQDKDRITKCGMDQNDEAEPTSTPVPACSSGLTLESVIDLTGEFEHLNELVALHLEKGGGFTCPSAYFVAVQPVLDLLEVELRLKCRSGMTRQEMKLVVQDWIDEEIRALRH
jgi:hypothetical protein